MDTETLKEISSASILESFRRWGYLQADLDPLGRLAPLPHPDLDGQGKDASRARAIYCGSIGVEFMHIYCSEKKKWIQQQMEGEAEPVDPADILDDLLRAELLEQFLQTRYLGTKRFSIEGVDALIPLLRQMLNEAGRQGVERVVLAMSHRGRLNVMHNIVGRPLTEILAGFEDTNPKSTLGSGDVKYHLGATGTHTSGGREIRVHLVSNPSHLEAVDPIAAGRARARQTRLGEDGIAKVLPIVLHGDAAFAGQGILAEVLNMSELPGFSVGGTIHVIVNNLIGFTAVPEELHSSRFASDVAKRLPIPIFHVNAEDPEAVVRVARMATKYRAAFSSDVVVDLIGYRRYGHSEVDDPTVTQPLLYRKIKGRPSLWKSYADKAGTEVESRIEHFKLELEESYQEAKKIRERPSMRQMPPYWEPYCGGYYDPKLEVKTGLGSEDVAFLSGRLVDYPEDFHIHDKVKKLLEQRAEMGKGERSFDFGMAEAVAFASLVCDGYLVRMSGQDTRRGTFNQRHAVLIDTETEEEYCSLKHISGDQAPFEILDSVLSEAAVLGFEYGFSRDYPDGLVLWEAQFGDFVNGAQVVIDQFIAAGEDKWNLLSGIVVLLPHGYEGQGPEHSSARFERFLQLAAEDNCQVCQPSTAAQYFHLLRRQVLRRWRKPLIVMTPKSMLRDPAASSPIEDLARDCFLNVIPDEEISRPSRILLCSGKVFHELREEREKREDTSTAIIALEQIYPFPEDDLRNILKQYSEARELVWVQEEPANMGALSFVFPRLERLAGKQAVRSVKRSASASPATGSAKAHEMEQRTLISLAFSGIRQDT